MCERGNRDQAEKLRLLQGDIATFDVHRADSGCASKLLVSQADCHVSTPHIQQMCAAGQRSQACATERFYDRNWQDNARQYAQADHNIPVRHHLSPFRSSPTVLHAGSQIGWNAASLDWDTCRKHYWLDLSPYVQGAMNGYA